MAINRVRARLRFTNASGMAAWAKANMGVRYTQAIHLNEGLANEELKKNDFVSDGASHSMYELDIPLMNESHAIDAYNTLSAILNQVEVKEGEQCFLERHTCYHDEATPSGCAIDDKVVLEYEEPPAPSIDIWVQPSGAHDAYSIGDKVLYPDANGQVWESKINANTTVPDGDEPYNRWWQPENN